ncbi:response regulator transcription factor [Vallitalea maricola]|uniref:Uncharacterized protein n=1 Tax=Vallitalea maricola TaxID=3074433 RepID=A0ACB5UK36_9FIRM|nr:hypothetical protein AN2V17_23540 [Vallitalea sp. AN17-2]
MFKLLIVEDEHIVRLALSSMINWEANNIKIVAEVTNGKEALDILQSTNIDIVITDINMSVMNGLKLLKAMNDIGYSGTSIVLSAYNDYDYIRQAFKLGASDYILKANMEPDNVLALVKSVLEKNKVTNKRKGNAAELDENLHERDYGLLLKIIAEDSYRVDEQLIRKMYDKLGFSGEYDCSVLLVDDYSTIIEKYGSDGIYEFSKHVMDSIKFQLKKQGIGYGVSITPEKYMILTNIKLASETAKRKKLELIINRIQQSLMMYLDISTTVGVANHGRTFINLHEMFSKANQLADLRYIYGKGKILYQENADFIKQVDGESIIGKEDSLIESIAELNIHKVDYELDLLLNKISTYKNNSYKDLISYYLELIMTIIINCSKLDNNTKNIFEHSTNFYDIISKFETKEEVHLWIKNFVKNIMAYMANNRHISKNSQIKNAKDYMRNKFSMNISLSTVAEYVELSENYLSKLFVSETGETFIQCLTRYRIEEATKLLSNTNMKINKVAIKVGYENVEHFSRVFKKNIGISPKEYQKKEHKLS